MTVESICPFGAKLLELREKAGLTKSGLAKAAGMNRGAISRLERGLHGPDLDTVKKLAAALKIPITGFLCPGWVIPPPDPRRRR